MTRFDVPGLENEIWTSGGAVGIFCPDVGQPAGCQLGGGASVNSGLWWNPPDADWDELFPEEWNAAAVAPAVERVFERLPGTFIPSTDGKLVLQQSADVLATGLLEAGWTNLTNGANSEPNAKNFTFSHTEYMTIDGERGGVRTFSIIFSIFVRVDLSKLSRAGKNHFPFKTTQFCSNLLFNNPECIY